MEFLHQSHSLYSLAKLGRSGLFQGLLRNLYVLGIMADGTGTYFHPRCCLPFSSAATTIRCPPRFSSVRLHGPSYTRRDGKHRDGRR